MKWALLVIVLIAAGCVSVKDYKYYDPVYLQQNASSEIPKVQTVGTLIQGKFDGRLLGCLGDYYIRGTSVRVEGKSLEKFRGYNVAVYGDYIVFPCDAECVCDPLIEADKVTKFKGPDTIQE
ncbi:MAG: hypothetical protein ABH829_02270 [archaeon]